MLDWPEVARKFGWRLRQMRHAMRLSQEEMSFRIGMDRTYYAGIEAGLRNPSLRNLLKIAEGFGVSPSCLFEGL